MVEEKQKRDWRNTKRQRQKSVSVRLSESEYERLKNDASRQSLTVGSYIRSTMLDAPIPRQSRRPLAKKDTAIIGKYLGELGKLGSNINQIARALNSANLSGDDSIAPSKKEVLKSINSTNELLKQIGDDLQKLGQ